MGRRKATFERRSKARQQHVKRLSVLGIQAKARKRLENSVFAQPKENEADHLEEEEIIPDLTVEYGPPPPSSDPNIKDLQGRRLVDVRHFITKIRELDRHSCPVNSRGSMLFVKEHKYGLLSVFDYNCPYCNLQASISTDPVGHLPGGRKLYDKDLTVNDAAVWGSVSIGLGHDPLEELLSVLGVPTMSSPTFRKHEESLGEKWQELMSKYMEEAAKEEIELAMAAQPIRKDRDGVAWTTCIVDGGWSQRSHGHRYTAMSGVAVLIGYYTKKLLFLGVRNKFCAVCARSSNKNEDPSSHTCFLNWTGPSTAMEADIIVEGFRFCEQVYKLRILKFVGDGDSSVLSAITNRVPNGHRVEKIECANHVVKNLTKTLHDMAKGSNGAYLSTPRIKHISRSVRKYISENKGNVQRMISDIRNVPDHVLGDHRQYRSEICKHSGTCLDPLRIEQFPRELLVGIRQGVGRVAAKAHALVTDSTSNLAENYMSLVAKFTGGKQVNRSQQGSYTRRCHAAGLSFHCRGKWHVKAWKDITTRSPNVMLKRMCAQKKKRQEACRKKLFLGTGKKHATAKIPRPQKLQGDEHYGPNALQPDPPAEELKILTEEYYRDYILVTAEESRNVEEQSRDQSGSQLSHEVSDNPSQLWWEQRRKRLTASNFGSICKMKETTSCRATVKRLLYARPVETPATMYGIANEPVAVAQYENVSNVSVQRCGLFIDLEHCYLAASPDGLVDDLGVLEVKCPYTARETTPCDAARTIKNFYCTVDSNEQLRLHRSHNYFYQIQGQIHITGRQWCDFVVWTPKGISIERIVRDDRFWENVMFPKLDRFFHSCLLPELANPRHSRGMEIREANYVLEAQRKLELKGKKRKMGNNE